MDRVIRAATSSQPSGQRSTFRLAERKSLYHQRGAAEREFGVLKYQRAMLPLRVLRNGSGCTLT
jgi:hypothetical protein